MTAAGTIPALPQYQPGALPLAGTEALEIVNTTNATSASSWFILLTDLVGKAPGVMSSQVPVGSDVFAFYRPSTGTYFQTSFSNVNVPAGNVPTGGGTGQILAKSSATNFDATWFNITNFVQAGTAITLTGSTVATLSIGSGAIGSTQIGAFAVQAGNIATSAIGSTQLGPNSVFASNIATNTIVATSIATGAIQGTTIATGAVQGTTIANNAITSTNIAQRTILSTNLATNTLTPVEISQFGGSSVLGVAASGTANLARITPANTTAVLLATGGGIGFGSLSTAYLPLTFQTTNFTAHSILVGTGSTTPIGRITATTLGLPLVAQGSATDPAYSFASVAGGGSGTTTVWTKGSVLFAGTSGIFDQDNSQFFWDNVNNNLGIGTSVPGASLQVVGSALLNSTIFTGTVTIAGSLLMTAGNVRLSFTTISTTYTISTTTDTFIKFTGTTFPVTLPTTTNNTGRVYYMQNSGSNATTSVVTLVPQAGQNINGTTATATLLMGQGVNFIADGVGWRTF